jgi:hypothetical protein
MESSSEGLAIKFYFKAGKTATETVEMVRAAYGVEALTWSNIFRWYGRFRKGREDVRDDPKVVAPLSLERRQHQKGSASVAAKSSPVTLDDSGWAWHQRRHCTEDFRWRFAKKETLRALCTACIDCRIEGE